MANRDSRVVDVRVTVGEGEGKREYGQFSARIRDYGAALSIELKTDMLIRERSMDPDQISTQSRMHFMLLAGFSVTCEKMPNGFSVEELMQGTMGDAVDFLVAYDQELRAAEERFRQGGKATPATVTLG